MRFHRSSSLCVARFACSCARGLAAYYWDTSRLPIQGPDQCPHHIKNIHRPQLVRWAQALRAYFRRGKARSRLICFWVFMPACTGNATHQHLAEL